MEWEKFIAPNLQNVEEGNYLVFEAAHQEEILNWLKREDFDKSQKDAFIATLIRFPNQCGEFYSYQAYFLAAKYINTFKNSSFADEIVAQLLNWSFDFFRSEESECNRKLEEEAQKALKYTNTNKVISNFENLIQNTENESILLAASEKLIEIEPSNQIATSTIVKILSFTKDKKNLFRKLSFLVKKSIVPEDLADILIKVLNQIQSGHSIDFDVWVSNTFYFLKKIAVGNQKTIDALIQLIERLTSPYQYEDEYLCEEAIKTLGVIGKNSDRAIDTLTNFLQNNPSDSSRCLVARALWYMDLGNLLAVDICTQLLKSSTNVYVIRDAALFLLKEELNDFTDTEEFTDLVINKLVNCIRNNPWIGTCGESISALEQIAKSNKNALQGLFQLLETVEDARVSTAIANSLLRIDSQNKQALTVISQALNTIEDDWKLYNVAKDLLDIDSKNETALDTLRKLLTISKEPYSRLEIAKRFVKIDPSNQTAINTLCELIYIPSMHDSIPEQDLAIAILEKIDPTKQLAIKAIEDFCQKTKNQDVLIYFIKHLRRLDPNNNIAQKRLDLIIAALINSMQTYDLDDDFSLMNVGIYWRGIMNSTLLPKIVLALKPYLSQKTSAKVDNYSIAYSIIWDCAEKMNYADFYRAWHTEKLLGIT
jgi:hypothetical protein